MTPFTVREAQEADAQALHDYVARLVAEAPAGIFRRAAAPSVEEEREFLRSTRGPDVGIVLLATAGERVIGMLDFHRERRPQTAHGGAFGMSVAREWRRQGVGSALLVALLAWADRASVTRIELQVFESNTDAIRLYERFGFQHEGRRRAAAVLDGREVDLLLMARVGDVERGEHAAS
jgi:RimJ/RimL family protein N-acetyltransferase